MSDYIKREDAIKWLKNLFDDCGNYMSLWHYGEVLPKIIELLEVDVAPVRHGRWELNTDMTMHCSCCGELFRFDDKDGCLDFMECAKYCIACGAKMDEVEDND